jgi:transposase-like protein
MGTAKPELKSEAIRLRVERRLSLREIANLTGAAKGSLSLWLQPYPLTDEEKRARSKVANRYSAPKKSHGEESKYYQAIVVQNLTNQQRGRVAEAAALFRLALHGFDVYKSVFDGDKVDCLVHVPESGRILKLQVRCVHSTSRHGLPVVRLKCADGHNKRRRYREGEFDFIIGYYLFNDTAYVFSYDEVVNHKTHVTIAEAYAERWDKLKLIQSKLK